MRLLTTIQHTLSRKHRKKKTASQHASVQDYSSVSALRHALQQGEDEDSSISSTSSAASISVGTATSPKQKTDKKKVHWKLPIVDIDATEP